MGGKSYCGSAEAAMDANIFPGVKIGIFRKTYAALNESITDKLLAMLPKELRGKANGWRYVRKDNTIFFDHNDSVIKLCYCENYNDALKYRGYEFDIIIIDEEADLDNRTVNFLKSTLRTAKFVTYEDGTPVYYPAGHKKEFDKDGERKVVNYACIFLFTANPEGPGFIRIRDEFVRPTKYGKLIVEEEYTLKSGKTVTRRKAFVQSKMSDNKYLNDDYELQFSGMSDVDIAKNVDGDWEVSDSNFFINFNEDIHCIDDIRDILTDEQISDIQEGHDFPNYWRCYGALDWGFYPDYCALSVYFIGDSNVVKRREFRWWKKSITEAAEYILEYKKNYNFKMRVMAIPHDMARKGEKYTNTKGEVLGETKEKVLHFYGIKTAVTRLTRPEGWDKVHDLMYFKDDNGDPVWRMYNSCKMSISQFQTLSRDETKFNDIREGQEDHFADSDRYFAIMYVAHINPKKKLKEIKTHRQQVIDYEIGKRTKVKTFSYQLR